MSGIILLFKLLLAHALCDFPLQGDFMAKYKDPGQPSAELVWPWCIGWHCFIHAGAVYLLSGSWVLGQVEFFAHFAIDSAKCQKMINFSQDQAIHVVVKFAYVLFLTAFPNP
jgi:Protein of unknown function (DUF3307)